MNTSRRIVALVVAVLAFVATDFTNARTQLETQGKIEAQLRLFIQPPLVDTQSDSNLSIALEPEFFLSWNNGDDSLEFVPFARLDQNDTQRSHTDIRELSWVHVAENWESRIGIRKEFWGVTEFQHLVDIINQTDAVEDIDGEDKLGQPMLNLSLAKAWGTVDFFILPLFRERTFASQEGRLSLPQLDNRTPIYEHRRADQHIDLAARWAHNIGDFDLGLSVFRGTSREPEFVPKFSVPVNQQALTIVPFYRQITQYAVDLQATLGSVLWKLEAIRNENSLKNFSAVQFGFEYSRYGIFNSNADLGLLIEYAWDSRGNQPALTPKSVNQNDVYLGSRLALNDVNSSELLAGVAYDFDFNSTSVLIEASRRFRDNIKLAVDLRLFSSNDDADPLFFFRQDDHVQLSYQYFY